MPALTNAAVLIAVFADNLPDIFLRRSAPPTPTLDRLVSTGVTTGLMLSATELASAASASTLQPQLHALATSQAPAAAVSSSPAAHASARLSSPPPSVRVFLIDAGSDLSLADAAAAHATRAFAQPMHHQPTRASNPPVPPTASALVGVLVAGPGEWRGLLPMPWQEGFGADFPLPTQSFDTGQEETSLAGFVAWSGEGLVRTDHRTRLAHGGTPPGEGFLRLHQIIAEPLSKTGLVDKYGA